MSGLVARVSTNNPTCQLVITENSQNSLKGIIWGSAGVVTAAAPLALTAGTVASLGGTIFASLISDSSSAPIGLATLSCLALGATYVAVKLTGKCFSYAIYHLGPQFSVTIEKQ